MKNLIIITIFSLTTTIAQASEGYQCNAMVPQGKVLLTINYAQNRPSQVILKFHNNFLNKDFEGSLNVGFFDVTDGGFRASGILKGTRPEITAYLSGSIEPSPSTGLHYFALGGRTMEKGRAQIARQLEFGYGNPVTCKRVR